MIEQAPAFTPAAGVDPRTAAPATAGPGQPSISRRAGRRAHDSVATLLADATDRQPLEAGDGKSGARLESVTIDGRRYVLKHVGGAGDWVARASGDVDCRAVRVWTSGLLDAVPSCLDHTVVDAAYEPVSRQGALLQRDVGPWLVPEGDRRLPRAHHRRFLHHMAALHTAFWESTPQVDDVGFVALETRYVVFSPPVVEAERTRGPLPTPLPLVSRGWERLAARAPRTAEIVRAVLEAPSCLVEPLRATPQTLLHGDWKAGNLGIHPDGRTILLDWTVPGPGPACADLAWYLAINSARLPERKEDAIAAYRAALHHRGIDSNGWWEPQLALGLLGAFVMLGWEKALGEPAELAWWVHHVEQAARWLN